MGWLRKIFKGGSSHGISKGHYCENCEDDPNSDAPSSSVDLRSEEENEAVDRAIAQSLLEDNQRGNNVIEHGSQLGEDEQLARAIQESLNAESSSSQHANEYPYFPFPFHFPMGPRVCAGCYAVIGFGPYLTCLNAYWHPECFRCHACNLPISDYEFSTSDNYPYHRSCYKENHHLKCDVCKHPIPTNSAGIVEYRARPFWIQKYCPSHEYDGTPRCCSCERMEPRDTKYFVLNDSRKLCLECLDSAIMDTNECQPLYHEIQEFYKGLDMKLEKQVPLLLVERPALNEARDGEKFGHYHMPETRGLCLSEVHTISTILKRPKIRAGKRGTDVMKEPYKYTRPCEVTAILILHGLPRLLTGSILAHEMMHAWLRLKGVRTLSQEVEEGICQVIAHMWLNAELVSGLEKGTMHEFERKLGEFVRHQIESDPSQVYGDGYRAGQKAVNRYGLKRTLDHVMMTGSFPY